MSIAHEILARMLGKPIPPQKQRMLLKLAAEVNHQRQQQTRPQTKLRPDAASYMDAHGIPLPKE